jgi:glyoxylase-like metal-dependent hydrolase (beta-lactamase superfamily II)
MPTPIPIMIRPPVPPMRRSRAGESANQSRAVPAASAQTASIELSRFAPEPRGFLREHIMIPGLTWRQISFEPTNDPTLSPFAQSLDVMGDGSLVMLPTPGHTAGSVSLLIRRRGRSPLLLVGDLTYGSELLDQRRVPGVGDRSQLARTTDKVLALKQRMPGLVILPAHDPTAAQRLLDRASEEPAQMKFTNTVTINRRPAEVFGFLAHFANVPVWNYAISETRKVAGGPVGVGARYRQTRTLPTRSEETFEVTEFEPDRRLSIRGALGPCR